MFFEKSVDTRSRTAMTEFLAGHYRYDGGYAHRVKIYQMGLTREQQNAAFDLLNADEDFWEHIDAIRRFTRNFNGHQTIGRAGRMGGHLVLYHSHYEPTGHRSYCVSCGQRNFKRVTVPAEPGSPAAVIQQEVEKSHSSWIDGVYLEQSAIQAINLSDEEKLALIQKAKSDLKDATLGNKCGRCGVEGERGRVNYDVPPSVLQIRSRSTADDPDDLEEMTLGQLQERVKLVREFDRACDRVRDEFIELLDSCQIIEEVVLIPKTIRRIGCSVAM
jgi:hypothetical protein